MLDQVRPHAMIMPIPLHQPVDHWSKEFALPLAILLQAPSCATDRLVSHAIAQRQQGERKHVECDKDVDQALFHWTTGTMTVGTIWITSGTTTGLVTVIGLAVVVVVTGLA